MQHQVLVDLMRLSKYILLPAAFVAYDVGGASMRHTQKYAAPATVVSQTLDGQRRSNVRAAIVVNSDVAVNGAFQSPSFRLSRLNSATACQSLVQQDLQQLP